MDYPLWGSEVVVIDSRLDCLNPYSNGLPSVGVYFVKQRTSNLYKPIEPCNNIHTPEFLPFFRHHITKNL